MLKATWAFLNECIEMLAQWGYKNRRNASHSEPMTKTVGRTYWLVKMELGEPLFSFRGEVVGGGGGFSTWTAIFMPP
ncbi:hypothetical protein OIU74_027877 [Salix koriyanagi]|uniref:Uncharacterized protein n=1 Tax=Salix koriyanagi TaxID=2511006 RepID=A0A9Q1A026_9ROSI|nr:hypothetical protein OIU74_027877 [Salix koriyanagi]